MNESEVKDRSSIYKNTEKKFSEVQAQLDRLTSALIKGLIDEDEFKKKKDELMQAKIRLKSEIDNTDKRADHWLEMTLEYFDFAKHAIDRFNHGDLEEKKQIFATFGSSYVLKDKILTLEAKKPFVKIKEGLEKIRALYPRFELEILGSETRKKHDFDIVRSSWLPEPSFAKATEGQAGPVASS